MAHPGAGSSAGGPPAGAVYVVVPMETDAAPAARVSARVTCAGAAPPPPAGAAGALVARAPVAAAAARPAWTRLTARLAWAAALFLLGCATAGLTFFAMFLPLADDSRRARLQGKRACAPEPDLRTACEYLLMAATAQLVAATMGQLVPARPLRYFGGLVAWLTAHRALDVLCVLVACHGSTAHGWLAALRYWLYFALLFAVLIFYIHVSNR